jgi:hypothetical protein
VRWLIPAAVVVTALGVLMLYVPMGKGVALIVPPQAPIALVVAGAIGMVVGVARGWWSRSRRVSNVAGDTGTRLADMTAFAGLAVALASMVAVASVFFLVPVLISLQGPDPCDASKGVRTPDDACFSAHPDYYQYDPVSGSISTPGSRLSQTIDPVLGPAAVPLALGGALISWLALAMRTRFRRTALSALTISSLIVVAQVFFFVALILGGGD